jgi:hypothetical protein
MKRSLPLIESSPRAWLITTALVITALSAVHATAACTDDQVRQLLQRYQNDKDKYCTVCGKCPGSAACSRCPTAAGSAGSQGGGSPKEAPHRKRGRGNAR